MSELETKVERLIGLVEGLDRRSRLAMMDRDDWLERRLGQIGIDVRESGQHKRMMQYLALLEQESSMTRKFMLDDQWKP